MELAAEELAVASTASPSPIPQPRDHSDASKQYFRLKSMSTLTAPVDEVKLQTVARTRTARLPHSLRSGLASPSAAQRRRHTAGSSAGVWSGKGGGTIEEEGKFPIPDNPTAWARYGFLEEDLLLRATGQSPKARGRRAASTGGGTGEEKTMGEEESRNRKLVRVRTDPGESLREGQQATASSAAEAGHDGERRHRPAASTAGEAGSSRQEGEGGDLSLDVGTSTPPTDIMTPSSEERQRKQSESRAAAAAAGSGGGPATAAAPPASDHAGPAARRRGGGALDSMAASILASSEAAATVASTRAEEDTKEQELLALEQDEAAAAASAEAATDEQQNASGVNRTHPQTIAEIERHKRNRAERLRAYGCQR